jgi:hypothetical protein
MSMSISSNFSYPTIQVNRRCKPSPTIGANLIGTSQAIKEIKEDYKGFPEFRLAKAEEHSSNIYPKVQPSYSGLFMSNI